MREFRLFVGSIVSIIGIEIMAFESSEVWATTPQKVVVCERPDAVGLYKQCYEANLLERFQGMARVYSLPERRVVTVPIERLFLRQDGHSLAPLKAGHTLAIPGRFLWNTAPEGYQSLCSLDSANPSSAFLTVSCGRYQREKILKDHALFLKPINEP